MLKNKEAIEPAGRSSQNLRKVIDLTYAMLELADHGDAFRSDAGCGIVYGALRDSAYKIRQLALRELAEHGVPLSPDGINGIDKQSNAPNEATNQNERKGK